MSKSLKMLFAIPLATSLMSCAANTTETVRTVSDFCLISAPITFSQIRPGQTETAANTYDTDDTAAQVQRHDLVYERICNKPVAPEQ